MGIMLKLSVPPNISIDKSLTILDHFIIEDYYIL